MATSLARPWLARPLSWRTRPSLEIGIEHLWQLTALAVPFIVAAGTAFTTDTWWALKMGQLSLQAGRPVTETILAYAPSDPAAVNGQWLAQVLLYLVYRLAGETGIWLLAGLLISTTLGLTIVAGRIDGGTPRTAAFGALLAALLAANNLAVRTQLFSYLLFGLVYLLLHLRHRQPRLLLLLPAIFALWTNLHGAFALGLLLLGAYAAGETFEAFRRRSVHQLARRNATRLVLATLGSILATSANPLGPSVYLYLASAIGHPSARQLVVEWQPPTLASPFGVALAASAVLFLAVWKLSSRPLRTADLLTLGLFGFLALSSLRYIVWWGIVLAPVIARQAAAISLPGRFQRPAAAERPPRRVGARHRLNWRLACFILLMALSSPFWRPRLVDLMVGSQTATASAPEQAADFLAGLPPGGRLFHFQPWTGYLAYRLWPGQVPMVDGRVEAHPHEVWLEHLSVSQGEPGWEAILAGYQTDYLVLDRRNQARLARLAGDSAEWTRLYQDGVAVIFGRQTPRADTR